MPIYEYQCEKCDNCFELLVFSRSDEAVVCPECGDKHVKRLLSSTCFLGSTGTASCNAPASSGFS